MDLVATGLKHTIRRSLRTDLSGLWLRGELPDGAALIAPNHHSWWDGYAVAELAWSLNQPISLMMTAWQLSNFPFFRRLGALDPTELRESLKRLRAGHWLVVFPEGELRPAATPGPLHPGAAWLARRAGAPLVPLAVRVVLRGAQRPEAYLSAGPVCRPSELREALTCQLHQLDQELASSDPEFPLAGYLRLMSGRSSDQTRLLLASRWLARLTGDA